jgi:alpha-L-fucosidase 2
MEIFGRNTSHRDPARPHQLGGGRLEIDFPKEWTLLNANLYRYSGKISIGLQNGTQHRELTLQMASHQETGWLDLPGDLTPLHIRLRPSWEWIGDELLKVGCSPPRVWEASGELGFVQTLPEDQALALVVRKTDKGLRWATGLGDTPEPAARDGARLPLEPLQEETRMWWEAYWKSVPEIALPDPELQEIVDYGLYLQAICTPPQGLACTLQGALMEETKIPPWSNDYHFNINLQMIYTPALATNRAEHFKPLWALLNSWLPDLKKSGAAFFQDPEALMLPHAVDDRCQVVGAFWTGSIDHACTAWMAVLCWDYYRYSGDEAVLRELAFPLLKGAFAGYRAMADQQDNGTFALPVSVSPEYKGSRMDAWGRNASFQLAACHAVLRALPQAAAKLNEPLDPRWEVLSNGLPPYTAMSLPGNAENPEETNERIVLWEGQDLEASHRHHSHLAGIYPFKTLDITSPEHGHILRNSLRAWQYRGAGAWSGWCVPWAASLHAYAGEPEAAVFWLHYWKNLFTNQGRASLHDAAFPGVSNLDGSSGYTDPLAEIMQLDGRFGALSAVLDLLVQERDGVLHILPAIPNNWSALSFNGILAPGGFLIDAQIENHHKLSLRLTSTRGGPLKAVLPDGSSIEQNTTCGESVEQQVLLDREGSGKSN